MEKDEKQKQIGVDGDLQDVISMLPAVLVLPDSKITRIGGLTNRNYRLDTPQTDKVTGEQVLHSFLVKVLNPDMGFFICREKESEIVQNLERSPKVIFEAEDHSVRVEEWIEGSGMSRDEVVEKWMEESGRVLKWLHSLEIMGPTSSPNGAPWQMQDTTLYQFLNNIAELHKRCDSKLKKSADYKFYQAIMELLVQDTPRLLAGLEKCTNKITFCHNDFNVSNLLLLPTDTAPSSRFPSRLLVVDYEYAGINYSAYDLANFLHEVRCEYLDDPPYFRLLEELDGGIEERLLKGYGEGVTPSEVEFFLQYSLYFWLWLCMWSGDEWGGCKDYVRLKGEWYRQERAKWEKNK